MGIQLGALAHRLSRRALPPPLVGVPFRGPHDLGPLERAGRQHDGASCGAAVLAILAALGDPGLATWLATGSVGSEPPPELRGATPTQLAALSRRPIEDRSAALQRVLKRRATSGVVPWPGALGTPPWGLAATARFPEVAYLHRPVDDADAGHLAEVLDRVSAATERGVPVPLYSGGDSTRGWASAVPRHVVLAIGSSGRGLRIWEPGEGRSRTVTRGRLGSGEPEPALGGWSRLVWVVLPVYRPAGALNPLGPRW